MKRTIKYLSFAVALFVAGQASAFETIGKTKSGSPSKDPEPHTKGANCGPASYRKTMSFNDVSAQLETGGLLFRDRANNVGTYRIPKTSQVVAIYAASLWMGGTDVNGQLKLAAVRFRTEGNDFWPGPLTADQDPGNFNPLVPQGDNTRRAYGSANIDPDQCLLYDFIFTIRKAEVVNFITWWECNNLPVEDQPESCDPLNPVPQPSPEVLDRIYAWPGNGDVGRQQDPFLAPFFDRGSDGSYDPLDGDYPWYDDILGRDDIECGSDRRISLFGDETHWWVFNDKGNTHTETGGDAIGMEIRAQAFSFSTDDEINRMTFYNYELINRGTQTLFNTYFAQYVDADLGGYNDDFVGCDVTRGLGYFYNGRLNDEPEAGKPGYGLDPPAIGVDFFEGPYQDADSVANPLITTGVNKTAVALAAGGIVYPGLGIGYGDTIADNERLGMRAFVYYTNGAQASQADPSTAAQSYNYMKGVWALGDAMVYGGTGFPGSNGATNIGTRYMFPGDSDTLNWGTGGTDPGFDWSEFEPNGAGSTSNTPGDRRFVQSAGPFTLRPGAVNNITVGIVYARSYEGDIFASVRSLKRADTKAQSLFDNCFRILEPPHAPVLQITELNNELILMISNPAGSNNLDEEYIEEDKVNIVDPGDGTIYDKFYRFEGYQIFQMSNAESTVADVGDPTKARLVAQCDVKNGVTKLVNFDFDEELGFSIPETKVDGADQGIRHTFRMTEDQFASGDRSLINHKTYYYIAVAYGYNNYAPYNTNDAAGLLGQKKPYLRSRINADGSTIAPAVGIPHSPSPQGGGTILNSAYGETPRITRLDGTGNGNRALDLTAASENTIVSTGYLATPEYERGAGPINVKVVDPLNVLGGYYECKFRDYVSTGPDSPGIDSASWIIYRYEYSGAPSPVDSATSEVTIKQGNEQIIAKWGVSVQIEQFPYKQIGAGGPAKQYADAIEATLTHADSSKQWVSFVEDDDIYFPTNWIRDGTFESEAPADCVPTAPPYLNPCNYDDYVGSAPNGMFSTLLGGGIAPHKLVGFNVDYMPLAYPSAGYASARTNARISYAPSIDIVFTSDKSKWTRCVVVELGRNAALNVGGQVAGKLRASQSVDKNGNPDNTGTSGMGWFPGYAIDLETGARLHMAFGENSFLSTNNGADMIWNPTSTVVDGNGIPVFGGLHAVWVFGYNIEGLGCPAYDGVNNWVYDRYIGATSADNKAIVTSLMWVSNILTAPGHVALESDARIRVRVNKEYQDYTASGLNGGKPMYSWSMEGMSTTRADQEQLASALDMINVVPNPYYAFSEYERNRLDNRVKITNLPDQCTVTIYNVSGKLIRTYKKDTGESSSIDWDLKNSKGIPISSGVYIIHVEVPGAGEKIIKFFGGMRAIDLENI